MDLFNILKRKKEQVNLDIPPPPPIKLPMLRQEPKLNSKEMMPFPVPRFEPRPLFRQMNIPKSERVEKPEFRAPLFRPKFDVPQFKPYMPIKPIETKILKEEAYIKADDFKDIMEHINEIKKKINESEEALIRLNEIKNREDKEFENWNMKFEDVQRKLNYIDRTFFGG